MTPVNFVDFIKVYINLLTNYLNEIPKNISKYQVNLIF